MSIWAEIKYALNSSLGTAHFKPINELYADTKKVFADKDIINCYATDIRANPKTISKSTSNPAKVTSFRTVFPGDFYIRINGYVTQQDIPVNKVYNGYMVVDVNNERVVDYTQENSSWHIYKGSDRSNKTYYLPYPNDNPNYRLISDIPKDAKIDILYYCPAASGNNNPGNSTMTITDVMLCGEVRDLIGYTQN